MNRDKFLAGIRNATRRGDIDWHVQHDRQGNKTYYSVLDYYALTVDGNQLMLTDRSGGDVTTYLYESVTLIETIEEYLRDKQDTKRSNAEQSVLNRINGGRAVE